VVEITSGPNSSNSKEGPNSFTGEVLTSTRLKEGPAGESREVSRSSRREPEGEVGPKV
jgi:hypothetical protein